ncbi:MAG: Cell surface protein [Candidatus Methanohalarchaeum thermophilum]|uniref:Cell surface protein n=1 Tax=Methanohalarchaeum thermophilum TaxID=1903181 RepID=A0A1Q6DXZ6_METT1|nr:MAG: Cell surface protein [Candidatus Methanohalarchaeum thermophilum]
MKSRIFYFFILFFPVAALVCSPVLGVPQTPHAFHGQLDVVDGDGNEVEAPAGVEVSAIVGEDVRGSKITEYQGSYGEPYPEVSHLVVQGENISDGDEISFFVNSVDTGQDYGFDSGAVTELNLTVQDSTSPSNLELTSPASGSYVGDSLVSFDWTDATDNLSGLSNYTLSVDGEEVATVDKGSSSFSYELSEGSHTWSVVATDRLGNSVQSSQRSFTVDLTAPEAPSLDDISVVTGESFSLSAADASDNFEINSITWDFEDGPTLTGEQVSHSYGSTGTYIVELVVVDNAGNSDTTTLRVDVNSQTPPAPTPDQGPVADAGGPYTVDEGNSITLNGGDSSSPEGGELNYSWSIIDDPTDEAELSDSDLATPVFDAPDVRAEAVQVEVELTVTDENGETSVDTAYITVASTGYIEVDEITPNVGKEIDLGDRVFLSMDVDVSEVVRDVVFNSRESNTGPSDTGVPGRDVYRFLDLSHENVNDEQIDSVSFTFRVEKSWLDERTDDYNDIKLYRYDDGDWQKLYTEVTDQDSSYVYYESNSPGLSVFSVSLAESNIEVEDLSVVSKPVAGESFKLNVTLTNNGDLKGSIDLKVYLDNDLKITRSVEVNAGEEKTESFELTVDSKGTHEIEVHDLTKSIEIKSPIKVSEINLRDKIEINKESEAAINLTNPSNQSSTKEIQIKLDEETLETREVTLNPEEAKTIKVDFTVEELGEHTISVGELIREFEVQKQLIEEDLNVEVLTDTPIATGEEVRINVQAEGEPVNDAILTTSTSTATTNENGVATLQFNDPGQKTITITKDNKETDTKIIDYEPTQTNLTITGAMIQTWMVIAIVFAVLLLISVTYIYKDYKNK